MFRIESPHLLVSNRACKWRSWRCRGRRWTWGWSNRSRGGHSQDERQSLSAQRWKVRSSRRWCTRSPRSPWEAVPRLASIGRPRWTFRRWWPVLCWARWVVLHYLLRRSQSWEFCNLTIILKKKIKFVIILFPQNKSRAEYSDKTITNIFGWQVAYLEIEK